MCAARLWLCVVLSIERHMLFSSDVFFQAEDGIRDLVRSRGLGDVYKRQGLPCRALNSRGVAQLRHLKVTNFVILHHSGF